jgi:hypothetical protein
MGPAKLPAMRITWAPIRAILRAEGSVNALRGACSAKIFWLVGRQHVDFSAHRKTRYCDLVAVHPARAMQKPDAEKTLNPSALLPRVVGADAMRVR